jgi:putative redox protein
VYIIYSENVHWSKGWDIPEINISLNFYQESDPELTTTISRSIRFPTEIRD